MASLHVGLAVGNGTGPELTAVFQQVIQALAAPHNVTITFTQSPRLYHSYSSLLAINDTDAVTDETLLDASHYRAWCEEAVTRGVSAIFRTSISAQALYLVREQLQAIKVEHFKLSPTASVLLVRDQAQGFYSGTNSINAAGDTVSRTAFFSKDVFTNIVEYALVRARQLWPSGPLPPITMIYKFHLFDGLFHSWAQEWQARLGVRVRFVQGDTMNRDLLAFGVTGHQLLISANEYADIMQTILLDRFGLGAQEGACAENVYLHPSVQALSEYQTAHGSADDLAGKGTVNPAATIRAAAAMLQNHAGCLVQDQVDWALEEVWKRGIATPDRGGQATTAEFANAVLQAVQQKGELPRLGLDDRNRRRAVVLVDLQNDMVTQYKDQAAMMRVTANIPRVLEWARQAHIEVIFVRFLGDEQFQPSSWRQRNQLQGRRPWCVLGTWGAEIFGSVAVQPGERVFDKKGRYDPFLVREFEQYVAQRGFEDLLVMGLYADVCVDATVRGAFQRGLTTTIVRGCMAGLHFPETQMAAYMQQVYGSNVIAIEELGQDEGVIGGAEMVA